MARIQTDLGKVKGAIFINNCAALRIVWSLPTGKTASNVLHFICTAMPVINQGFAESMLAAVVSSYAAGGLAPFQHTNTKITNVGIRDMSPIPGSDSGHGELLSAGVGTGGSASASDPLPAGVAFCVSLRTARSGQANRGRVYIPGFVESANTASGLALDLAGNAAVGFINTLLQTMHARTPPFDMAIAQPHRAAYTGRVGAPHAERAATAEPVVTVLARNMVWDTQRRRQRP